MNTSEVLELINRNQEIAKLILLGKSQKGWDCFHTGLAKLQNTVLLMIEKNVIQEDLVMIILNDIMAAMENHDEVLLADTLQYGLNELLGEALQLQEEKTVC